MDLRSVLRRDGRRTSHRARLAALILALGALQGPATANDIPQTNALVPYFSNYNGQAAQMTGQIIEYKAAQVADSRGLQAAAREAFIAASLTGGGIATAAGITSSARVQNAAIGGFTGGAVGALGFGGGCLAVALATTAGFATPLCALPMLAGGIGSGVAVGAVMGLFQGKDVSVTNPGNQSADANLTGGDASKGSSVSTDPGSPFDQNSDTYYAAYNNYVNNTAGMGDGWDRWLTRHGINQEWVCAGSQSEARRCVIGTAVPQGNTTVYYPVGPSSDWGLAGTMNRNGTTYTFMYSNATYPTNAGSLVPTYKYQPVVQSGYPLVGMADNPANRGNLDTPLSSAAIAAFMNQLMKNMPAGSNGLTNDPTNPITAADVDAALANRPGVRATLGDMIRPFAPPGQAPQLGSSTNNVTTNYSTAATQNPYANPNSSTSGSTSTAPSTGTSASNPTFTKEVAPASSDQSTVASSVLGPIQTLFSAFPKPKLTTRSVACPTLSMDLRGYKSIGFDSVVSTDFHCQLVGTAIPFTTLTIGSLIQLGMTIAIAVLVYSRIAGA